MVIIVFVEDVEWVEARLVLGHADKDILLLLLRLLRGVEEGVEDAFKGLDFIDWTSLRLHLVFRVYLRISLHLLTERQSARSGLSSICFLHLLTHMAVE